MNVTYAVWEFPEPPPLHTDDEVRAIGAPALKPGRPEGDVAEHWLGVWELILWSLRFFGAPAALYESCTHRNKDRTLALGYLRALEAMIRRILLIMASEDARPLEPWLPRKARGPAKGETKTARAEYRGMPPENLPIRFVLIPPLAESGATPRATDLKRVRPSAPIPEFLEEPLPPELDNRQTRRAERLMIADYQRALKEKKRLPVYALVARFEALIRVYKDPARYVMRIRQRIAAEQGRHAEIICAQMLKEPVRLSRGLAECLTEMFWQTCAAVRLLRGRAPPIVPA